MNKLFNVIEINYDFIYDLINIIYIYYGYLTFTTEQNVTLIEMNK